MNHLQPLESTRRMEIDFSIALDGKGVTCKLPWTGFPRSLRPVEPQSSRTPRTLPAMMRGAWCSQASRPESRHPTQANLSRKKPS